MYSFGRMFEILLSKKKSAATGDSEFAGGIVVQPESSKRLYYIFGNATRYKFQHREQLHAHGLGGVHIHTEVPYEVISAFPPVY